LLERHDGVLGAADVSVDTPLWFLFRKREYY